MTIRFMNERQRQTLQDLQREGMKRVTFNSAESHPLTRVIPMAPIRARVDGIDEEGNVVTLHLQGIRKQNLMVRSSHDGAVTLGIYLEALEFDGEVRPVAEACELENLRRLERFVVETIGKGLKIMVCNPETGETFDVQWDEEGLS